MIFTFLRFFILLFVIKWSNLPTLIGILQAGSKAAEQLGVGKGPCGGQSYLAEESLAVPQGLRGRKSSLQHLPWT